MVCRHYKSRNKFDCGPFISRKVNEFRRFLRVIVILFLELVCRTTRIGLIFQKVKKKQHRVTKGQMQSFFVVGDVAMEPTKEEESTAFRS